MQFALYPSLAGKLVFIVGGSSGIGSEIVKAFAAQGSQVAFCGIQPDGGAALIESISGAGDKPPYYDDSEASDDSDGITGQNLIVNAGLAQVSVAG